MQMSTDPAERALYLFVPADRPERFAKAAGAGADAIIIDLEDAIAPPAKDAARAVLSAPAIDAAALCPIFIRLNGIGTAWHGDDVAAVAGMAVDGVILPKTESGGDVESVRARLPQGVFVLAIVETAKALAAVDDIAASADRIIFGSIDFAADLGCAHQRDALLLARSRIVLAARLAGKPAPVDGVTLSIRDEAAIEDDARYGASLGFGGKLLIHPAQVGPARRGMAPTARDFEWASNVVAQAADGAARAVDGTMVDAPVLLRARQIVRAHQRFSNGS